MTLDRLYCFNHFFADRIPRLVGALQSFFRERLNSDQGHPDAHFLVHGAEILFIARGFAGHLGKGIQDSESGECSEGTDRDR